MAYNGKPNVELEKELTGLQIYVTDKVRELRQKYLDNPDEFGIMLLIPKKEDEPSKYELGIHVDYDNVKSS